MSVEHSDLDQLGRALERAASRDLARARRRRWMARSSTRILAAAVIAAALVPGRIATSSLAPSSLGSASLYADVTADTRLLCDGRSLETLRDRCREVRGLRSDAASSGTPDSVLTSMSDVAMDGSVQTLANITPPPVR